MKLYEEIIFLKHWFKGKFVVENVKSYYDPLIKPFESNNHYFWSNFIIPNFPKDCRGIRSEGIEYKQKRNGFNLENFELPTSFKEKILNNCVKPEVGLDIFNSAFRNVQTNLFGVEK